MPRRAHPNSYEMQPNSPYESEKGSPFSTLVLSLPCLTFSNRGMWAEPVTSANSVLDLSKSAPSPHGAVLKEIQTRHRVISSNTGNFGLLYVTEMQAMLVSSGSCVNTCHTWCTDGTWYHLWLWANRPLRLQICCPLQDCPNASSTRCTKSYARDRGSERERESGIEERKWDTKGKRDRCLPELRADRL